MALVEDTLFGRVDKVQDAIARLRSFAPKEGKYYVAFSGGKDSQCIYELAKMAEVPFEAHYNVTSVDPPQLLRFIKNQYPDVIWDYPRYPDGKIMTMWNLIESQGVPPTRQMRWCCDKLKETGGEGNVTVTGVRWSESARRKDLHGIAEIRAKSKVLHREAQEGDSLLKNNNRGDGIIFMDDNSTARRMVERCYVKRKTTIDPIVDWTEDDVWEFLNDVAKVPHCSLYDNGLDRIGCIGCPLAGRKGMERDFDRWPRYKAKYINAFQRAIDAGTVKNKDVLESMGIGEKMTGEKMMEWWLWMMREQKYRDEPNPLKISDKGTEGQETLFERGSDR